MSKFILILEFLLLILVDKLNREVGGFEVEMLHDVSDTDEGQAEQGPMYVCART